MEQVSVNRSDLASTQIGRSDSPVLQAGEVRVRVEKIGLSSNNISYAATGDALGYWAHFSKDPDWGSVPVWGFAAVTESQHESISVGERIFGFLPMASEAIFSPTNVTEVCFTDASNQRAALHPWYTRLYRCASDPVFSEENLDVQPTMWALFMTGWMMADELNGNVDTVVVSSASSKTALSLGWALKQLGLHSIGLTSKDNRDFVSGLGVYSEVVTYDQIDTMPADYRTAYVDIAGNAKVTSDAHVRLGESLSDSVLIGSTHRAPSAEPLPMPGPAPRFFFIPDVAEQKAQALSFERYHGDFAAAWKEFATWSAGWLEFERGNGAAAIEQGYLANLKGGISPTTAMTFVWD